MSQFYRLLIISRHLIIVHVSLEIDIAVHPLNVIRIHEIDLQPFVELILFCLRHYDDAVVIKVSRRARSSEKQGGRRK